MEENPKHPFPNLSILLNEQYLSISPNGPSYWDTFRDLIKHPALRAEAIRWILEAEAEFEDRREEFFKRYNQSRRQENNP